MSNESKSIWKKSWRGPRGYLFGIIVLTIASFVIVAIIGLILGCAQDALAVAGIFAGAAFAVVIITGLLAIFIRWLFSKGWRWTLLRLACFAGLIGLFYAEEFWRGKWAWEHFRREWEAKGEKFDFKAFIPPPVPDEQNFALTPLVASCYGRDITKDGHRLKLQDTNIVDRLDLNIYRANSNWDGSPTNGSWQKGTLTNLKGWQDYYLNSFTTNGSGEVAHEFPVAPQMQTPAADVLLALSKYGGALKELAEANRLPASRFPLEYDNENPAEILLPHLSAMKRCAQVLQLRALAELEAGQSAKACEDTLLIFQLTEKIKSEPFLITHLVRIAMIQIAVQVIYEGQATHRWLDTDLARLSAEINRQNYAAECKFAMRGEMGWQSAICDFLRTHPEQLAIWFSPSCLHDSEDPAPTPERLLCHLIPSGWFYQNQVNCARVMVEQVIPIANDTNRTFSVKAYREMETSNQNFNQLAIFDCFQKMMTPALGAGCKKFALCQNALNLANTAIALERYRLAHGEYPELLDALAPQWIAQVPHDVINGQPLKYRREANGQFVIYSVGWNETDDGGLVVFKESSPNYVDIDKGDWVWRYPDNKN